MLGRFRNFIMSRFGRRLMSWAARRPPRVSLYYLLSFDFVREQHAVLCGQRKYDADLKRAAAGEVGKGGAVYIVRRYTHMLEKGMTMRPRRGVFALGYIEELVGYFKQLAAYSDPPESIRELRRWTEDVLVEYFEITDEHPTIVAAKMVFDEAVKSAPPVRVPDEQAIPYRRDLAQPSVSYDDLLQLAYRRRSCRWFKQEPVPRELIDKAIHVAGLSPSACNRQPFKIRVYDDPELVGKLIQIPAGTGGYGQQVPCVVIFFGDASAFANAGDRHLIYTDSCLAAMSMQFACETLGLGTCAINWRDTWQLEQRLIETLGLEPHERAVMFMAVGFPDPDGTVAFSQKKPLSELRSYNERRLPDGTVVQDEQPFDVGALNARRLALKAESPASPSE